MRRRTCTGACKRHCPPPGPVTLRAVAVPTHLSDPLAGYLYLEVRADGTRLVDFDPHTPGVRSRRGPLPKVIPESWADAMAYADRFLAGKVALS